MRAAVYTRVSSEEQARSGYSLDYQADRCTEKARSMGASDVTIYKDEGISGAVLNRPGLSRLRDDLRQGRINLVVVLDPDRFARNVAHQLLVTEEIERLGAVLEFVNFEWRNTPEGQLFYAVRGAVSQYEKEKIRERTMAGRLQKARAGLLPQAHRPYGYAYDPAASSLVPQPAEAKVVQIIYTLFTQYGLGYTAIARRLDDLGVPPRRASRWHRQVVYQILVNPVYTGVFWVNRYNCRDLGLNRYRPPEERRRPVLRDAALWIGVPVPALVESSCWQAAQERIAAGLTRYKSRTRRPYLLRGLVRCAVCGATARAQQVRARPRPYAYYYCPASHAEKVRLPASILEETVWTWTKQALDDPQCLSSLLHDTSGPEGDPITALAQVEDELRLLDERRTAASRAFAAGVAGLQDWETVMRQTTLRAAALAKSRAALKSRLCQISENHEQTAAAARWILQHMDDLDVEKRRRLVERMVEVIFIGPDNEITIRARVHGEQSFTQCQREGDPDAPARREEDPR